MDGWVGMDKFPGIEYIWRECEGEMDGDCTI